MTADDSPFSPGDSLCAYLRDSGGNNQDLSVIQQQAAVEGLCEQGGYVLTHVYADVARPGGTVVGRDEFSKMIEYFSSPGRPEAGVVFWDYSRFSRNYDDGQFFLSMLRRNGYKVYSMDQQIPSGAMGKIVESMHIWASEEYRQELGRKVKRGQHYIVGAHKAFPRRFTPSGYRKAPHEIGLRRNGAPHIVYRLEPDPDAAPRVRLAFEMRAAGRTIPEIHTVTQLFKYRQGYERMFRNEIYRGVFHFGASQVADYCEPLVDADTWDKVQEINRRWQEMGGDVHPRRAASSFLLSGLVRCGICGAPLSGANMPSHGLRKRYYRCGQHRYEAAVSRCLARMLPEDELDARVLCRLRDFLSSDEYLQAIVDELRRALARQPDAPNPVDDLRANVARIESGKTRIVSAIVAAGHSEALLKELASLESQETEARQKLARAEADERQRAAFLAGMDPARAQQAALDAKIKLESHDTRARQLAVRELIFEVKAVREKDRTISGEMSVCLPGSGIVKTVCL